MTDIEDRKKQIEHVNSALAKCGYLSWCFRDARQKLDNKVTGMKKKYQRERGVIDRDHSDDTLYEWGLRRPPRVFTRNEVAAAMKLHKTIKLLLVHPKDKRSPPKRQHRWCILYCVKTVKLCLYGRNGKKIWSERKRAYMQDMEQLEGKKITRSRKKEFLTEVHKSALTEHAGRCNHAIDWVE